MIEVLIGVWTRLRREAGGNLWEDVVSSVNENILASVSCQFQSPNSSPHTMDPLSYGQDVKLGIFPIPFPFFSVFGLPTGWLIFSVLALAAYILKLEWFSLIAPLLSSLTSHFSFFSLVLNHLLSVSPERHPPSGRVEICLAQGLASCHSSTHLWKVRAAHSCSHTSCLTTLLLRGHCQERWVKSLREILK